MDTIHEPARNIPVLDDVDVCVIGGSCTGVFAAVRAARLGARVCLVERNNCFGGAATAGFVCYWHSLFDTTGERQVIAGLTQEMVDRLGRIGAIDFVPGQRFDRVFNSEEMKIELDGMVRENRIRPFLHTVLASSVAEGRHVRAAIVENKSGRGAIRAGCFIDASGDGDLAWSLGVASYDHGAARQAPSSGARFSGVDRIPGFRLNEELDRHGPEFGLGDDHGWWVDVPDAPGLRMGLLSHVYGVDCSRADDLTFAEMEGRSQVRAITRLVRQYSENGKAVGLAALASNIGIRETRHFRGLHTLREADLLAGRREPDAIANGTYRVDIHQGPENAGVVFRYLDGTEEFFGRRAGPCIRTRWKTDDSPCATFYQVPYRTLVPAEYDNLLMAGRMIDADRGAFGAIRVMVNLNQLGEAAGVAAVESLDSGRPVRAIDTTRLRDRLRDGGSILP